MARYRIAIDVDEESKGHWLATMEMAEEKPDGTLGEGSITVRWGATRDIAVGGCLRVFAKDLDPKNRSHPDD